MRNTACVLLVGFLALTACVQAQNGSVQTLGELSFAVPEGWTYSSSADGALLAHKEGASYWMIAVFLPMPASGNPTADFKAAWRRVVLKNPGFQDYPYSLPYDITQTVGYSGKFDGTSSADNKATVTLYTLETGKSAVPVECFSANGPMLEGMNHMIRAVLGSVRVAPLKAVPIQQTFKVSDLAGSWATGNASSLHFYNSSGQYTGSSLTAGSAKFNIVPDGHYTYRYSGLANNQGVSDADTGVVELGDGFITFKGQKHVYRYRLVTLQQAIDGSTVLTLFPPVEMSKIDSKRDSEYWIRAKK
ncbi:MAG TPA: hypothetical protein VF532_08260 [Candidatus Angelobacter sp.]